MNSLEAKNKLREYYPNQSFEVGYFGALFILLKDCVREREFIWQLYLRDFWMLNKKTFLGFGWHFISPLVAVVSWIILNSSGVLVPGEVGMPYPVYVLLGSSLWGLFVGSTNGAMNVLNAGSGFINQVSYPHHVLLVKNILHQFSIFLIAFIFNLLVFSFFDVDLSWLGIFFPLALVPLILLASALGLLFSILGTAVPDLKKVVASLLGFFMYVTPVIYSFKQESWFLGTVIKYNPLSYLIDEVRNILIFGKISHSSEFFMSFFFAGVFFVISFRIFFICEQKLIEKML